MKIYPLFGIGNITFGMSQIDVQSIIGKPKQTKKQTAKEDDSMHEVWCYDTLEQHIV